MTLPAGRICCSTPGCGAVAADRRRPLLSIDVLDVLPAAGYQQTRRTLKRLSYNGTDGWTDRRTTDHYIDPVIPELHYNHLTAYFPGQPG